MNQNGSAVALVLVVLGVVSLIGAAALIQSRHHLWSATAHQAHDKMFYWADGASSIATKELSRKDEDPDVKVGSDGKLDPYIQIIDDAETEYVGDYLAQVVFYNYETSMSAVPGEEEDTYVQHWDCQGYAKMKRFFDASSLLLPRKDRFPEAQYVTESDRETHRGEFSAGKQVSTAAFAYRRKN
jgi:hypothetical protein